MMLIVALLAAHAQESADIEVAWPAVNCGDRGTMLALSDNAEEVCVGFGLQGAVAPLVWRNLDGEDDWLIDSRVTGTFSVAATQGRGWAFSMAIPLVHQSGEAVAASDQQAVGDLMLAEAWNTRKGAYDAGVQLAIRLPTGKRDAWVGERFPRARLMGRAATTIGRHRLGGQAGLSLRARDGDRAQVATGPRAFVNIGWLGTVSKKVETWAHLDSRVDLLPTGESVFSSPVEARMGLSVLGQYASVDTYVGRAVYPGVGSSILRLGVALRANLRPNPGQEPPSPLLDEPPSDFPVEAEPVGEGIDELSDEAPPPAPVEPPNPGPPSSDLPSVLLTTLLFEQGSATLRPESRPALTQLGAQLVQQPGLGPMLIEGHASEEGTFAYNYELSLARASAIYLALIQAGVRPERLTMRARGEVLGRDLGGADQRRRVEVRLIVDEALIDGPTYHPVTGEELK